MEKVLNNFFYPPPKSPAYAGAQNLLKTVGKKHDRKKIIKWLESQDAYTLHKPVRRHFPIGLMTFVTLLMCWHSGLKWPLLQLICTMPQKHTKTQPNDTTRPVFDTLNTRWVTWYGQSRQTSDQESIRKWLDFGIVPNYTYIY